MNPVLKWLKIYEDEIKIFFWSVLLLFLIRVSNILFNNFAETAFLKRFGVEYLPIVYVANSITTFVIMGILAGIMARLPAGRLLSRVLVFCGISVGALRFVIPLGIELIYPVLFVLKSQYEVLLGLFFWNMANDLFNTRQSKRLFPLITAGGVIGGVAGSFGTPLLAKFMLLDNLMLAYTVTTILAGLTVKKMASLYPAIGVPERKSKKIKKRSSPIDEFKKILPIMKESLLVKILIMLTLIPNIIIPIINYQFNFVIDQTFATESGMINFFGYFRGALNIISFIILLFVGKIYGRWGLPVALMFHPFNYLLAFLSLLLRFDIVSAIYARVSTNVLRTTINNPARAVLMGLFPASYRSVVRPFLRGTVVRIGILIGSGIIMLTEGWLHPRFLSIFACIFTTSWIGTVILLKKRYSSILIDLISKDMIDFHSLEKEELNHVFMDKGVIETLKKAFSGAKGKEAVWYGKLLRSLNLPELDSLILEVLKNQDQETSARLVELLSDDAGGIAIPVFTQIIDPEKKILTCAVLDKASRFPPDMGRDLHKSVYERASDPEVKAYAIGGLYQEEPDKFRSIVYSWLRAESLELINAGIIGAGRSGDRAFIPELKRLLNRLSDGKLISNTIDALNRLRAEDLNNIVLPFLRHSDERVRISALNAFLIKGDEDMKVVIGMLDDSSDRIYELAKEKLESSEYTNPQVLIESLSIPRRKVREGIFDLLESLNVSDVDVQQFMDSCLEKAYTNVSEAVAIGRFPPSTERDLLIAHLNQKKDIKVETLLRVLSLNDRSGRMRLIWRGIFSSDSRRRSNALEALEDMVGRRFSRAIVPLIEGTSPEDILSAGSKFYEIPKFDSDETIIINHLLGKKDWVTLVLTLNLIKKDGFEGVDLKRIETVRNTENPHIRGLAEEVHFKLTKQGKKERSMENVISIPDKVIHLRKIQIFEGLNVSELAAIASVTEEKIYPEGETVIREGEQGDTMYMIVSGEVSVFKEHEGSNIELDRIKEGDYFGEMALFDEMVRSATIVTTKETRVLVLHKHEFREIVREYPQIALHICRVLSQRLRKVHERISDCE